MSPAQHPAQKAYWDGRNAAPGTVNPYAGQGIAARMWQIGYDKHLQHLFDTSPARRRFLDAQ